MSEIKSLPPIEVLLKRYHYDADTGIITHKLNKRIKRKALGSLNQGGYLNHGKI